MEAMRQYGAMAQPFPYEKEVALYDGEYNGARQRVYYEPDEDFYNSISAEEFKKRAVEVVKRVYKRLGRA